MTNETDQHTASASASANFPDGSPTFPDGSADPIAAAVVAAGTTQRSESPALTLVTGAAGWVGRALVERLLATRQDGRIRILVRNAGDIDAFGWRRPGLEVVVGDVTRIGDVERFFAGLSGGGESATGASGSHVPSTDVIHAAGVIHPESVAGFYAVNTEGTKNIVATARRSGVRRLVHVSSNSPFGTNPTHDDVFRNDEPYRPYFNYGISKMQGELAVLEAVRADGLDAVIVRPPWFYGPFQPARQTVFFTMIKKGRFPVLASGEQRRSMVYIDNLVDGIIAAELTPGVAGKGYWIADAKPYSINEIVATVASALRDEGYDASGKSLRAPGIVGKVAEFADKLLQGSGRYNQQIHVLGEMDKTIACDISAARAELGYDPKIDLHEGMRRSIQWCKQNGIEL